MGGVKKETETVIVSVDEAIARIESHAQAPNPGKLKSLLARIDPGLLSNEFVLDALAEAGCHFACRGDVDCVRALLGLQQAELIAKRETGPRGEKKTWMLMEAAWGDHADCIEALLPFSDAKKANAKSATALHMAAERGAKRCVELLLPHSESNAQDTYGRTPLEIAVQNGEEEIIPPLLAAIDPAWIGDDNMTILEYALWENFERFVSVLLLRCDPRARNSRGLSAIEWMLDKLDKSPERAKCADLMVDFLNDDESALAISQLGREKLPRIAQRVDAEKQRQELLAAVKAAEGGGDPVEGPAPAGVSPSEARRPRSL